MRDNISSTIGMYGIGIFPSTCLPLSRFLTFVYYEKFLFFIAQGFNHGYQSNSREQRENSKYRKRRREREIEREGGGINIKLQKRNVRRKQVRKISFPPNDEEGRGNSQRVLFPICGYPLHRWSKLAGETQDGRWRRNSPSPVLFMPRRHCATATPSPVIKVPSCAP